MKNLLILLALSSVPSFLFSQGDDCSNALYLPDVTDFCSGNGAYTSAGSTASGYGIASCWNAAATSDVWFSFIATGTEMLGSVTGSGGSGGTLVNPRVALYSGVCGGTINELSCNSGAGAVQFYSAALIVGQTYYIRVSTTAANRGTFKLCANNYTPPNNPGADCSGATKLCDKSTVGVGSFGGSGVSSTEPNIAGSCMSGENNSVWYKWTCETGGTLTFDITPLSSGNDIDFVLFQLAGINNCGSKSVIRCNTSSCTIGNGSTGISTTDGDISEDPGCDGGENAYSAQITMVAGTSYALLIDNANANNGFNLSFGGNGTFVGASPVISPVTSTLCAGGSIVFDGSTSTNVSGGLNWTFSNGTTSTTQTGPGPFIINYPSPGNYVAILEGIDATGCHSTQNVSVTVSTGITVNAGPDRSICAGSPTTLTGTGALTYSWDNSVTNNVAFTPASTQTYTLTGTDGGGCQGTDQVIVTVNPLPVVSAGPDQAVCPGGSVTLTGSGATSYTWNNGVTNSTAFTPASTQTYTVTGTTNGCDNTDQVIVTVNTLPVVNAGPDQSICTGGSTTLSGSGATSYTWNNGVTNGIAFTPASTQTYTVTGTDANGCQNTDQVTVNVAATLAVSAGPDQSICIGQSVTLTGSGATTYSWNNSVNNGAAFTPASTQTYTVTGSTASGCTNTDQVVVTVNALPIVNAGADQAVCNGTTVVLNGSGATSYTWNNSVTNGTAFTPAATTTYTVTGTNGNGCQNTDQVLVTVNALPAVNAGTDQTVCTGTQVTFSGSGATSYSWTGGISNGVAFTPLSTQTYTVTGTGVGGCTNTDQVLVTVNPLPAVNAGQDQSICAGGIVTLSGSGATSYVWNNSVTNGVAFTPSSTTTYTVTGTDGNGCQRTDQVLVTVNALPVVNAGADRSVCAGGNVTLTGSGATSYTWNNGVSNNISFVPVSTATYTVTGTNVNGCVNTDQVLVTVNPLPPVNAGADRAVCIGAPVTLTGSGATSYTWNNGVSNNVPFTPASTTTYTVTGTDGNGCQKTDAVTVTVNPLPVVTAGSDQTVCLGETVVLTGGGASSYSWNNGVSNNIAFTPSSTTVYTVTGTDANGCVNTASVNVAVVSVPVAVINTTGVLQGNPGLVVGFDNGSSNANSYSWNFGNGQTDVTTDITDGYDITYTNLGVYTVTLVADNGYCTSTATKTVVIMYHPVVIINIPNVITPNNDGTNDVFNIDVENASSLKIQIVNRWGENVREFDGLLSSWDAKTEKGDEVTSGVYFFTYEIVGLDGSEMSGQGFVHVVR